MLSLSAMLLLRKRITAKILEELDSMTMPGPHKLTLCLEQFRNILYFPTDEKEAEKYFEAALKDLCNFTTVPLLHCSEEAHDSFYGPLIHGYKISYEPCWRVEIRPNYLTYNNILQDKDDLLPTPSRAHFCRTNYSFTLFRLVAGYTQLSLNPRFSLDDLSIRMGLPSLPLYIAWNSCDEEYDACNHDCKHCSYFSDSPCPELSDEELECFINEYINEFIKTPMNEIAIAVPDAVLLLTYLGVGDDCAVELGFEIEESSYKNKFSSICTLMKQECSKN